MLVDKTTGKTYSSRATAIRDLGKSTFDKMVKRDEITYISVTMA